MKRTDMHLVGNSGQDVVFLYSPHVTMYSCRSATKFEVEKCGTGQLGPNLGLTWTTWLQLGPKTWLRSLGLFGGNFGQSSAQPGPIGNMAQCQPP
jgi:hypothetical protein